MAIICQQIATISSSYSTLCGRLIRIYDILPRFDTIDVLIETHISPQVSDVGNSFTLGNERYTIQLISKNVAAGTAVVQLTIADVYAPPPVETSTHHLDFYVQPHSWYTPGGAADDITLKLSAVTGAIINGMSDVGLTDWQYVSTKILTDASNNRVIIRVNLNQLGAMGTYGNSSIQSMAVGPWVIVGLAVAVVIIGIGIIVGWALIKAVQQIMGETYTGKQVGELLSQTAENLKKNCGANFPNDAAGYALCLKSGGQSVTQAGGDFFKDPKITQAGEDAAAKIDACMVQYNAGKITAAQLKECSDLAVDDLKGKIIEETKDKGDSSGGLILLGVGLIALYIVTRGAGQVATPVLIERERLRSATGG